MRFLTLLSLLALGSMGAVSAWKDRSTAAAESRRLHQLLKQEVRVAQAPPAVGMPLECRAPGCKASKAAGGTAASRHAMPDPSVDLAVGARRTTATWVGTMANWALPSQPGSRAAGAATAPASAPRSSRTGRPASGASHRSTWTTPSPGEDVKGGAAAAAGAGSWGLIVCRARVHRLTTAHRPPARQLG